MKYKAFTKYSDGCPVEWKYSDNYEIVVDMETNKVVCMLGEPEDRTFYRDIKDLLDLLNARATKEAASSALREIGQIKIGPLVHEHRLNQFDWWKKILAVCPSDQPKEATEARLLQILYGPDLAAQKVNMCIDLLQRKREG